MRVFAFLLVLAVSSFSQALPDAAALFKESAERAKERKSFQFSSEMTVEMTVAGNPVKMVMTSDVAGVKPDKMRIESKSSMGGGATIVSTGEFTYTYIPPLKQYTKKAALSSPNQMLGSLGITNLPDESKLAQNSRVLREEALETDGVERPCWVIETKLDKIPLPAPPGAAMTDAVVNLWLDKEDYMNRRMTMSGRMQMGARTTDMKQEMRLHSVKLNIPLAETLFTFVPPEGAKEVPEFAGPGMKKADLAGKPAPAFALKSIDGKTIDSTGLKGKVVLLDFWTTWCAPCRKEMPALAAIHSEFKDAGLILIGVNVGEDRELVEKFLKTTPAPYPIVLSNDSDIVASFQVSAFPTYVLIGRDGNIAAHQVGSSGEESLRAILAAAGLKPEEK
jgi:thiol-disulfide isomerase/thioredoxin